jgi:hypothetical protein
VAAERGLWAGWVSLPAGFGPSGGAGRQGPASRTAVSLTMGASTCGADGHCWSAPPSVAVLRALARPLAVCVYLLPVHTRTASYSSLQRLITTDVHEGGLCSPWCCIGVGSRGVFSTARIWTRWRSLVPTVSGRRQKTNKHASAHCLRAGAAVRQYSTAGGRAHLQEGVAYE